MLFGVRSRRSIRLAMQMVAARAAVTAAARVAVTEAVRAAAMAAAMAAVMAHQSPYDGRRQHTQYRPRACP